MLTLQKSLEEVQRNLLPGWHLLCRVNGQSPDAGEHRREITAQELDALLSGIDLSQARRRKRYQRPVSPA